MHQFDSNELEIMASGIVDAIRKYAIPVEQLTDQQIWKELKNKGYRFPVGATSWDTPYRTDIIEVEVDQWFEALHLALKRVRS